MRWCVYEDGDNEELSFHQLQVLAQRELFRPPEDNNDWSQINSPQNVSRRLQIRHQNVLSIENAKINLPPVNIKNAHGCCFADTLIQNIISSRPLRCAILESAPMSDELMCRLKYPVGYDCLQLMIGEMFKHPPGHVIDEINASLIVCMGG